MDGFPNPINENSVPEVEMLPGIFRRTLAHCPDLMLVRFFLRKDAQIPLHDHLPAQLIGHAHHRRFRRP